MARNSGFQNEIPPARVNIRLSVEGAGEAQKKELPLKLLVLGRFVPGANAKRVGEREKWAVSRENFDGVMATLGLRLEYSVRRCGGDADETMPVSLRFDGLRSFGPAAVASQVPELARLQAARNLIRDLGSRLLDDRQLRRELENVLRDNNRRRELACRLRENVDLKMEGV